MKTLKLPLATLNKPLSSPTSKTQARLTTKSQATLKEFVLNFDFENPQWDKLPPDFPNLDKSGLSTEEGHLLDGIKLAWLTGEGRETFYKSVTRKALVGVTTVILIVLISNLLTKPVSFTKSAQAKTLTEAVGEVVEATMSAVFRK